MSNLASTLRYVTELREALSMKRAVFEKYKQILGENHPDTLSSMNNLAIALRDVRELQEALSMMRVVFKKRQQILGEDNLDTLSSMHNLASTLMGIRELQEALSMMRVVFEKYKQILGEDHPHTLSSMSSLASTLGDVGELQEALSMKRTVFEKRQQILGDTRTVNFTSRSPSSSPSSRRFYRLLTLPSPSAHPLLTLLLTTTHLFGTLRRTMSLSISAMPTHRPIPSWRKPVIGRKSLEDMCISGHKNTPTTTALNGSWDHPGYDCA